MGEEGLQRLKLGWEGSIWGAWGLKGTLRNECGLKRRCRTRVAGCGGAPRDAQSRRGCGTGKGPKRGERLEAGTGSLSHRTRLRRLSSWDWTVSAAVPVSTRRVKSTLQRRCRCLVRQTDTGEAKEHASTTSGMAVRGPAARDQHPDTQLPD